MKLRLAASIIAAVGCITVLASGDSYWMTYQATSASHPAKVRLLEFAMARHVQAAPSGGSRQSAAPRPGSDGPATSGQVTMVLGKNAASETQTFKPGAQFEKITIAMFGTTPTGATIKTRHWVLSGAVIDSFTLMTPRSGPQATVNLHWKSITSFSP